MIYWGDAGIFFLPLYATAGIRTHGGASDSGTEVKKWSCVIFRSCLLLCFQIGSDDAVGQLDVAGLHIWVGRVQDPILLRNFWRKFTLCQNLSITIGWFWSCDVSKPVWWVEFWRSVNLRKNSFKEIRSRTRSYWRKIQRNLRWISDHSEQLSNVTWPCWANQKA